MTKSTTEEYMDRARQLDEILKKLTRDYCATDCPKPSDGCCDTRSHGLWASDGLLDCQEKEALIKGYNPNKFKGCIYHASDGCILTSTKSPKCIGFLCKDLKDIIEEYDPTIAEIFNSKMDYIAEGSLIHHKLECRSYESGKCPEEKGEDCKKPCFEQVIIGMDQAIEIGKKLIDKN